MSDNTYIFELSEEAKRLGKQAQFLAPLTQRMCEDAGIKAGMKVLDVGCGAGDVTLLLAEMVGPHGIIVGVDRNPTLLEIASARVRAAGLTNVSFVNGDLFTVPLDDDFDAVVGRLVLVHVQDKVALLRRLSAHVRPGGIVAFQEPDHTLQVATLPKVGLFEQAWNWRLEATRRAGIERQMGLKMYGMFLDAGLSTPEVRLEQMVGGGPNWGGYEHLSGLVRGLLPLIVQFEIATAEEVAINTLTQRIRDEVVSQGGVVKGVSFVSAWARTTSGCVAKMNNTRSKERRGTAT
ncbi:MAG TPA: class I SAM-dependent methyltransferase [Ktedonobacteraceae bacterium]